MQFSSIKTEVANIIDDTSFSASEIGGYVNEALAYTAQLVKLPSLKAFDTVDTTLSTAYSSLSSLTGGFSGVLSRVNSSTNSDNAIVIYPSLESLVDAFPEMDEAGDVEGVALEGSTLWYQKIPATAETLSVLYYKNPTALSADDSTASDIPSHLHRNILVHGACFFIYDQIEDGMEGDKVNTNQHFNMSFNENNKHSGIVKLREWAGMRRVHYISSVWSN